MRRNDEDFTTRRIGQRINFRASADTERAASVQEKRNVRAKAGSDFKKARGFDAFSGEAQQTDKRGGGVARSTTQAAADGNALRERSSHALLHSNFAAEFLQGAVDEVVLPRFTRELGVSGNAQFDAGLAHFFQHQDVVQRNGLENRAQFVVAVGAAAEDIKAQIHLRIRWNANRFHRGDMLLRL